MIRKWGIQMKNYFDPRTGELIGGEIVSETQNNPQHGQTQYPQYVQPQYQQYGQQQFQHKVQQNVSSQYRQNFQKPQRAKASKGTAAKKFLLGIGILCSLIAVAGIILFIVNKIFMSNPIAKISVAAINTFEGRELFEALNPKSIMNPDGTKVELFIEKDDEKVGISAAYQMSEKSKTVNSKINLDVNDMNFEVEGTVELNEEKIVLSIPQLNERIFTYYYTKENDGFLTDEMDDEFIEKLNIGLSKIYELGFSSNSEETKEAMMNLIRDELSALKIEELEKDNFVVNDKEVQCGGYLLTVTKDNILNIVNGMLDIYNEFYSDSMDDLLGGINLDSEDFIGEIEQILKDMPALKLSFYLYHKQLSCVKIQLDDQEDAIYTYFYGGDYPAQNLEIIMEDEGNQYSIFKVKGFIKNHVENIVLEADTKEVCEIHYNQKTGEVVVFGKDNIKFTLSAVIHRKKDTLGIEVNDLTVDGWDENLTGSILISGDVDFKPLEGEEINLGTASKEDLEDVISTMGEYSMIMNHFQFSNE